MQVLLKRNWFTPIGRFKKAATKKGPPVEIPDSLRGRLPSDAVIVDEDVPVIEEDTSLADKIAALIHHCADRICVAGL